MKGRHRIIYACLACEKCEITLQGGAAPEGFDPLCPLCAGKAWWVVRSVVVPVPLGETFTSEDLCRS